MTTAETAELRAFEAKLAGIERKYRAEIAANETAGLWRVRLVLTIGAPLVALLLFWLFGSAETFLVAEAALMAVMALTIAGQLLTWAITSVISRY